MEPKKKVNHPIPLKMIPAPLLILALACLAPAPLPAQEKISPPPPRPPGVTSAVEQAIEKGLEFLKEVQEPDGRFGRNRNDPNVYPTAMSSLVGLAFLASGSTLTRGPYAPQVQKIAGYLLENCTRHPNGLLTSPNAWEQRHMYSHAFAMTFLSQIFGQETDPPRREKIRQALRDAVKFTGRVQTDDGGWGYYGNHSDDEGTLTVTQLTGLRACRDAGIIVPKEIIDGAVRYIERSTDPDGGVRYRVSSRPGYIREGVTCAAVITLWKAGRYEDPYLKRITDYVNRNIGPQWTTGNHAAFVEYYLAQAKYIMGGDQWLKFYKVSSATLVGEQEGDGSWSAAGYNTDRGEGEIYATAVALLILQLPYNRLAIYQR